MAASSFLCLSSPRHLHKITINSASVQSNDLGIISLVADSTASVNRITALFIWIFSFPFGMQRLFYLNQFVFCSHRFDTVFHDRHWKRVVLLFSLFLVRRLFWNAKYMNDLPTISKAARDCSLPLYETIEKIAMRVSSYQMQKMWW